MGDTSSKVAESEAVLQQLPGKASETLLIVTAGGGGGMLSVSSEESQDADEHPSMHRMAPPLHRMAFPQMPVTLRLETLS